jgi:outer membrane biosynthesis protein TonB
MSLALIALAALAAASFAGVATRPPATKEEQRKRVSKEVKRIVKESNEIIDGKRDSYTDDAKSAAEAAAKLMEKKPKASTPAKKLPGKKPGAKKPKASTPAKKPKKPVAVTPTQPRGTQIVDAPPKPSTPAQPSQSTPATPPGYDPAAARRSASSIANHLQRSGRSNYDRRLLEQWQRQAGVAPDRIYGGATRGALIYYGVKDPPGPFFPPTQTVPFVPPEKR